MEPEPEVKTLYKKKQWALEKDNDPPTVEYLIKAYQKNTIPQHVLINEHMKMK